MIVIISLFAKNNNSFSNPAARKKRIFPRQAPTLLANAQRESSTLWYPHPPPERWHEYGYCCRIECTVEETRVRFARASSLYRHGAVQGFGCSQQAFCNANGVCIDRHIACYNGVGSEKFTASELCRCPNLSYNEDVLRERSIA